MRQLLDSRARTILLIAPAGYGKTTLARQWADQRGAGWFTARLRSADVAELARGLADSLAFCAPTLPRFVDETLSTMQHPAHEVERLAAAFLRTLPSVRGVLLALDDYQLL